MCSTDKDKQADNGNWYELIISGISGMNEYIAAKYEEKTMLFVFPISRNKTHLTRSKWHSIQHTQFNNS